MRRGSLYGAFAARTACLLGCLAGFLALLAAPQARADAPQASAEFFGVNGTYLGAYDTNPAKLDTVVADMQGQGISWARIVMGQHISEKQDGVFNWGQPDLLVAALARHGIRAAPVFVGTAQWAATPEAWQMCGSRSYPHRVQAWADWVGAAVRRYGPTGSFWTGHPELPRLPVRSWEIGNEPNFGNFWCPTANPEAYAAAYSAAADAVEAADPGARAILGGLMGVFGAHAERDLDVPTFLRRMTAADPSLRDRIPAVAIHPYEGTPDAVLARIAQYRSALRAVGMQATPMVVNEVGWRTGGPLGIELVTETVREDHIAALGGALWRTDCGLEGMAPFAWVTAEQNQDYGDQWFGLADPDTGEPYPSGLAYGQRIRLALGQEAAQVPTGTIRACSPVEDPSSPPPPNGPAPPPSSQSLPAQLHTPTTPKAKSKKGKRKKRRDGKTRRRARKL